jgi:CheY-like chemotaxis protein
MSRILLVDDSPHAQRMGERILSEDGFEVVTVSNADSALIRLDDVDPDVVIADTVMPGRSGYEICQYVKMNPRLKHVRVILTAGVLENFDEEQSKKVEADGTLKKPFEATALVAMVKPLAEAAKANRAPGVEGQGAGAPAAPKAVAPFVAVVDAEQVRAAVTLALDGAMETMVEEITRRVLASLQTKPAPASAPPAAVLEPEPAKPPAAVPSSNTPIMETVRRVTTLRGRSLLGLDVPRAGE